MVQIMAAMLAFLTLLGFIMLSSVDAIPVVKYHIQTIVSSGIQKPAGVCVLQNSIYFADQYNHCIRKYTSASGLVTVAGTCGSSGDSVGSASTSKFNFPYGVSCIEGSIFIADQYNNKIKRLDLSSNTVSTVAGTGSPGDFQNDGVAATTTKINTAPHAFATSLNEFYIADFYNHRVRKVDSQGIISTVAGKGVPSGFTDNVLAGLAQLNEPHGVFVDNATSEIYIADKSNHRIRKVGTDGMISTIAGNGNIGFSGDNVRANETSLKHPTSVYVTANKEVLITDHENHRLRKILMNGTIITIAGNPSGLIKDDWMDASMVSLNLPTGVFVTEDGHIYFSERDANKVRILTPLCDQGFVLSNNGLSCDPAVCFGYLSTDGMSCSGHGYCISNNVCSCFSNWASENCSMPKCFGIEQNSTSVCSGHGTCNDVDTCECSSKWGGSTCALPKCFEILQNSTSVCSGHGSCNSVDTCVCHIGWSGTDCSIPKCFGILQNSTTVCGGHGACDAPDICRCSNGWFGSNCSMPSCFEILQNSTSVCSNHGSCINLDTCECSSNWGALDCSIPKCYGILQNMTTTVCNGHGLCDAPDTCRCNSNWGDHNCSMPKCFEILQNSTTVCNGHGSCDAPNTCRCTTGWGGPSCTLPTCYGILQNETLSVCNGHGACQSPDSCECHPDWGGANCSLPKCYGILQNETYVCNEHGICEGPNICNCTTQWGGSSCALPKCYGFLQNETTLVCSGHGICSSPDHCYCNPKWFGYNCKEPSCNGTLQNSSAVCNGHGTCEDVDVCKCHPNWEGSFCTIPKCFSVLSNESTVCNGHGVCTGPDMCSCFPDYLGVSCENRRSRLAFSNLPKALIRQKNNFTHIDTIILGTSQNSSLDIVECNMNCKELLKYKITIHSSNEQYTWTREGLVNVMKTSNGTTFDPFIPIDGQIYLPSPDIERIVFFIQFSTTQAGSKLQSFNISIPVINSPLGKVTGTVVPLSGESLTTLFTIQHSSLNISSELLPLQYAYGFYYHEKGKKIPVRNTVFNSSPNTTNIRFPYQNVADGMENEYIETISTVQISPFRGSSNDLIALIMNDTYIPLICLYDKSLDSSSEDILEHVALETAKRTVKVEDISGSLARLSVISSLNWTSTDVASIVSSHIGHVLNNATHVSKQEKANNGYVRNKLSIVDVSNMLAVTSNLLSKGFSSNITEFCESISSLVLNYQIPQISDSHVLQSTTWVTSELINVTVASFRQEKQLTSATQFSDVNLDLNYILNEYNGFSSEVGLSMIIYASDVKTDIYSLNNSIASFSKEFTFSKNGVVVPLTNLQRPIYIQFDSLLTIHNSSDISCRFWNETTLLWDNNGCKLFSFNNITGKITCECSHTTLFSAFVEQNSTSLSGEQRTQVSSLFISQIIFGCLYMIISLTLFCILLVFRKEQPITSRVWTPFIGTIALFVNSSLLLVIQRSVLLAGQNNMTFQQVEETPQSSTVQWENGDLTSNIIANIVTIISNTLTLTAVAAYLYQVIRYQLLKYFYEKMHLKFEKEKAALIKVVKYFISPKTMAVILVSFGIGNMVYWTLLVILIRCSVISRLTYTHVVSISYTCLIIIMGIGICGVVLLDFIMSKMSSKKNSDRVDIPISSTIGKKDFKTNVEKVLKPLHNFIHWLVVLDSPLFFRVEMLLFMIYFVCLVVLSGLSFRAANNSNNPNILKNILTNDAISLIFEVLYIIVYLFVFGGYSLVVVLVNKIKKFKKIGPKGNEENVFRNNEMMNVLRHTEGKKLFANYCKKEFSLENYQLWTDLEHHEDIVKNQPLKNVKDFISLLYRKYIEPNAVSEVNIPSECRKQFIAMLQKLSTNNDNTSIELTTNASNDANLERENVKHCLDNLLEQIVLNLEDTFSRFYFSADYEYFSNIMKKQQEMMIQSNLI